MWDFSFAKSAALLLRTFPFMLIRAAVYFGAAAAFVIAAGGMAGIGLAVGALAGSAGRAPGAFWGAIAGFMVVGLMLWWLRDQLRYLVRTSHLAAMTMAHDRKRFRAGAGRLGHPLELVQQRFRTPERLSEVDRLTRDALADMLRLPAFFATLLPPETRISPDALRTPFRLVFAFLADIVLARQFRGAARDPWPATRDGLILLSQSHAAVMPSAIVIAVFMCAAAIAAFAAGLMPAAAIARAFPGANSAISIPLAAIFAWSVKQVLLEPFAVASMLQAYFRAIDGRTPDTDWDTELARVSEHFREIKGRAAAAPQGTRRSVLA